MQRRSGERFRAASYDRDFYDAIGVGSRQSARVVVPMILDLVGPVTSVVDVGCGTGAWLRVFSDSGTDEVLGIDGDYVGRDQLEIPAECFRAMDLSRPIALERRFDLVVCLEVAEHLPLAAADPLVEGLTGLGDIVLFSAAIPYQGGREHLNEQWPAYWAEKFRAHDFAALDPFRPRLWADDQVEPWIAQNLALYVSSDRASTDARLADALARTGGTPLSLVHPRLYVPKARSAARLAALADSSVGRIAKRVLPRRKAASAR
jgi:SAM-dependent methyltransferase